MTEQAFRSVFAICGLALGILLMSVTGLYGIVSGAIFGAGGAVLGGIIGEQVARRYGAK